MSAFHRTWYRALEFKARSRETVQGEHHYPCHNSQQAAEQRPLGYLAKARFGQAGRRPGPASQSLFPKTKALPAAFQENWLL